MSDRLALGRLVPSGRILLGLALLVVAALGCWWLARETSVFATRAVRVQGASAPVTRAVERTLESALGESLVALDLGALTRAVEALPTVADVRFDRSYPSTLRVEVTPERPVAVIRQGSGAFLVSERGRVVASLEQQTHLDLPRVWARAGETPLVPGAFVGEELEPAVRALSPQDGVRLRARVVSVRISEDELTLRLRRGLDLRLGNADELALKLVVAARVLPLVRPGSTYLDVSVVERPVAGMDLVAPSPVAASVEPQPEVEVETQP